MNQRQNEAWTGFFVFRLDNYSVFRPAGTLLSDLGISQMRLSDNGEHELGGYQSFGALYGMLQHRTATDKVDILFGQRPFSQGFNERLETFALAASQYQSANHFVLITVGAVLTGRVRHRTMKSIFLLHETLLPHPPLSGSSPLDYFSFPRGFRFGLLAFEPLVSPAAYFLFLIAVFGLQSSLELLIVTFNLQQIIIRKFTPLLL